MEVSMSLWVSCSDCTNALLCTHCNTPVYCLAVHDAIDNPTVQFHVPDECEYFEPKNELFEPDWDDSYDRWKD